AFCDACRPQQILSQVAEKPPAFQGAETRRRNSQRVDLTPLRTAFLAVVFEKASLHCFSLRTREQKVRPWPDPGSLVRGCYGAISGRAIPVTAETGTIAYPEPGVHQMGRGHVWMYNYDTPDPKGYAAFPFSERGVHPMKPEAAWGDLQRQFWNRWNSTYREREVSNVSLRQAEVVTGWLERLNRRDLTILEVGCGSAWFCPQLTRYGAVTGTDLSDE